MGRAETSKVEKGRIEKSREGQGRVEWKINVILRGRDNIW